MQVDFVGYIRNPCYARYKAPGLARQEAVALQNKRLVLAPDKADAEAARAARVQARIAAGEWMVGCYQQQSTACAVISTTCHVAFLRLSNFNLSMCWI